MGGGCSNCSNHPIRDFFRDIFGKSSGGGCGYHPGPSENERHAKKIADEFQEMKEKMRVSSEESETAIMSYLDHSIAEFLSQIKAINRNEYGGKSLNLNIEAIQQKNEELKKSVIGHIGDYMDAHLIQTDPELSVILEERDDAKRGANFDKFVRRIQVESLKTLKEKINDIVEKQEEMLKNEISARLNEVDRNVRDKQNAFKSILESSKKEKEEIETNNIKYYYNYELCQIILDIVSEG